MPTPAYGGLNSYNRN